jgi:hypothetical protein
VKSTPEISQDRVIAIAERMRAELMKAEPVEAMSALVLLCGNVLGRVILRPGVTRRDVVQLFFQQVADTAADIEDQDLK